MRAPHIVVHRAGPTGVVSRFASSFWLVLIASLGCGARGTVTTERASPANDLNVAALGELDQSLQSAHEFALPAGEPTGDLEFLAAVVKEAKADFKLPFLATCRIEHGGRVTTGSIIHSSPRFGTYVLSCRHGREEGGPWEARCRGGAMIYGSKHVVSKNSDLCLLIAPGQYDLGPVRPIPLRLDPLQSAEPCLSIGFDNPLGGDKFSNEAGDRPRAWTEEKPEAWNSSADGHPLITTHVASGPGRSGGGLFIVRTSELIGVCSFRNAIGVQFVGRNSVLDFLNRCRELGHIPWWKPVGDVPAKPKEESPKQADQQS